MGLQSCIALALLFLAGADPSRAQNAEVAVREGAPLTVECALRVEQRAQWLLEGAVLPADLALSEVAVDGHLMARLHASRARLAHAGLYSCGPEATQRVRVLVHPADNPVRDFTPGSSSPEVVPTTPSEPAGPVMPAKLKYYDVHHELELNCTQSEAGATYVWKKNGTAVESLADLGKRLVAKDAVLRLTRTTEDDYGNYTCGVSGVGDVVRAWEVHARPVAKLQPNVYAVEGQKLRVTCRLIGKPYVPVEWRLRNGSEADNSSVPALDVLGERGAVRASEQGVEGAELLVEPVERSDGGDYFCVPLASNGVSAETTLRVKDKRAALWPFLGICAEVFVLCAIILVYEKRRTKPELDDSDTDNHEQKKS